ncbi:metallophosphoesterase [Pleionea mediterranea]|uniref:Calcineurin-like phosphoesterase family protein n=1 Tax=Pleionea mediterranea TaxID=523701 RepID=A0A316FIB6_9GAMM|nr:metallophosphoesterase [Pleionea mediterranea]PWK47855.1 calcineurin-like phosphoesterase family protein [Pleionea mediterranea]
MLKTVLHNLKHFFITLTIMLFILVAFGIYIGATAHLIEDPLAYKLDREGPHVFFDQDHLVINTLRGSQDDGFYIDQIKSPLSETVTSTVYFPKDDTEFTIELDSNIQSPPTVYNDNHPIIAISDIESGYKSFRDFLISNKVIDDQLNWIFNKGHLVLVGDFVDRGASTTQVLWFIYRLEKEAIKHGGKVHFILGNHEIKALQGNYKDASPKYFYIASILGKHQYQLFGQNSFIGRWMNSKNTMEVINGNLFVHGGIHPDLGNINDSIDSINQIVRDNYREVYYTKPGDNDNAFLTSTTTGPSWYRGYFKDDLSHDDIKQGLKPFNANSVVVGHTIQWNVSKLYDGLVYAIDVSHPKDYLTSFPPRSSEGLLIDSNKYYRLTDDGSRTLL